MRADFASVLYYISLGHGFKQAMNVASTGNGQIKNSAQVIDHIKSVRVTFVDGTSIEAFPGYVIKRHK